MQQAAKGELMLMGRWAVIKTIADAEMMLSILRPTGLLSLSQLLYYRVAMLALAGHKLAA